MGGYLLRISNDFPVVQQVYQGSNQDDGSMAGIAKGMTLQTAQAFDTFITSELTNFLRAYNSPPGLGSDLAAINIQRGRDTGISGWSFYRKACIGSAPKNWKSRPKDISEIKWAKLQSLYTHVRDIDLYTGMLSEDSLPGAILGATSACIVAEQFQRSISGDRFFFTHGEKTGAKFTSNQIAALKKVRMFDILCLNTNIHSVQMKAFGKASWRGNPLASCGNAAGIDVRLFI